VNYARLDEELRSFLKVLSKPTPEGNLYVVDTMNHRVQKFTRDGKFLLQWGKGGTGPGEFNMPWGIAVDDDGEVYVADWRNDYRREYPDAAEWVYQRGDSVEAELSTLDIPALLLWATRDPLSPAPVGRHLASLLPQARLIELDDDNHMFARDRAAEIAPLIQAHLEVEERPR